MKLLAISVLLLATACAGGGEVSGDRRVIGDVTMAFTVTPARVEVGKAVRLSLRLTNHGGRIKQLDFASGQLYDFWVTKSGDEVWRWSDDRTFTQATERREIASQDTLTLAESWTTEGVGTYVAHALLRSEGFDRELTGKVDVGG
jgi:hypothetical protein